MKTAGGEKKKEKKKSAPGKWLRGSRGRQEGTAERARWEKGGKDETCAMATVFPATREISGGGD